MNLGSLFMALTLVKFKNNKIKISAAGMPPALIYKTRSRKAEQIMLKGLPLGGFPNFQYKQAEIQLSSGDGIVLMSDGLPERFNNSGETFDYPAVIDIVEKVGEQSSESIIKSLVEAGEKWSNGRPQDDDITFVVLKITESN